MCPQNAGILPTSHPRHHHYDTAQAPCFSSSTHVVLWSQRRPNAGRGRMRNTSTLHFTIPRARACCPVLVPCPRLLFIFSPPASLHANTSLTTPASQTHKQATKHILARHHASPRPVERHPSSSSKRPGPAAARNATHHGLAHPAVVVESVEPHQQQQQQQEKSSSDVLYFSSNAAPHAMLRHLSRRQRRAAQF